MARYQSPLHILYDASDRKKESTASSSAARELYDESREKDTKAAVMLGVGSAAVIYGIHLWLSDDSDKLPDPKLDRGMVNVRGVAVDVGADPASQRVGLQLRKGF